jgi:hypothetical protein
MSEQNLLLSECGYPHLKQSTDIQGIEMNKTMEAALEQCLEHLYAPSANCSCHISPPCTDCVDYAGIRGAIRDAKSAISQQPAQPTVKESLTVQSQETDREVARYSFEEGSLDIKEDEFGNYIEISDYEALRAENEQLKEENKSMSQTLQYVERWANHHSVKPTMTAVEALSCIQHYPRILYITRGYADGKVPTTPNPFTERDALQAQVNFFNEEKIKAGINWHKENP